jgi:hypothetical protein
MRTQISNSSKRKWLYTVLVSILLFGGLFGILSMASAQEVPPSLQLSDLPHDFIAILDDTYVPGLSKGEDVGHPLTADNLYSFTYEELERLLAYTERQSFGALHPGVVLVNSFTYNYASESEAMWAAKTLYSDWESKGVVPIDVTSDAELARLELHGRHFIARGNDEITYWFFGHRGKTLIIFLSYGLDEKDVGENYHTALVKLSNK